MTKAEITRAYRILRGKKREIFKEMVERKKYFHHELGPAIANLSPSNFGLLRAELTTDLAILLSERRHNESPRELCRKEELRALAFQMIGEVNRAVSAFTKAAEIMLAVEDWHSALHMLGHVSLLLAHQDNPELDARMMQVADEASSTLDSYKLMQRCRELKRLPADIREIQIAGLEEARRALPAPSSTKARLFYAHAGAVLAVLKGDMLEAERLLTPIQQLLIANPGVLNDPLAVDAALSVQLVMGWILMSRGEIQAARDRHCELVASIQNNDTSILHSLLLQLRWLEIKDVWIQQRFEEFDELEAALAVDIEAGMFPNKQLRGSISAEIGAACIERGTFRRALHWFELAFIVRNSIPSTESLIAMGLSFLLANFGLQHWDTMESHIRAVRRLLAARGINDPFIKSISSSLLRISRNPKTSSLELTKLQIRLGKIPSTKSISLISRSLNVVNWLKRYSAEENNATQ